MDAGPAGPASCDRPSTGGDLLLGLWQAPITQHRAGNHADPRRRERSWAMNSKGQRIMTYLLACLGTATVASLIRFESAPEAVVIGYAAMVLGLELVAWFTSHEIFTLQALVMLGVAAFSIATHSFFYLHESFSSSFPSSIWAISLLAVGVPLSFLVRKRERPRANSAPG